MQKMYFIFLICLLNSAIVCSQEASHVPDELLVQVESNVRLNDLIEEIELVTGTEVLSFDVVSDILSIYQIKFELQNRNLSELQRSVKAIPGVMVVQKNHYVFERETIPSDTLFPNQWHHKNTGQTGGLVDADIDSPEAWDITTGGVTTHGDTIVVCVIEGNGVDLNHIDLQQNIWRNYSEVPDDGIDNDNNGYIDDYLGWHVINQNDVIGAGSHGTRVSGMIGASGNNITGNTGINWKVKMMIIQGQQASNEASVIAAYTYPLKMRKRYNQTNGQEGAFVVATSSSWGIDGGDPADSPLWCAMYDSLGYYGILSMGATTNNNSNVDLVGDMPSTCASEFLVTVTMTNSQDLRANSGYGTTHVDLGAPGFQVHTTSPGNIYVTASGTSFATPLVTGCIALAYSAPCPEFINLTKYDPAAAAEAMRTYLLESVDQNPGLMSEVASGGRANVKKLIDSLLTACTPGACIAPYYIASNAVSDTSATLTWSGFGSDYVVYLQEGNGSLSAIDATGLTSITVDTLIPCTWYTVYIQTNCGTDSSVFSYPYAFRTDGCCENPALVLDSKTTNSITLNWDDVLYATYYDVRYKHEDSTNWIELLNVLAPLELSGLNPCTNYDVQIHTQCADSTQGYSASYTFRTSGCGACTEQTYCVVSGANSDLEWIDGISVNGYSNLTGNNNGWLQSNQIITALTPGASYNISFTPGYSGFNFTEGFSVWIDFDGNGTFEITEQLIDNLTNNAPVTGILNIPISASIGVKRMRIGMNATDSPVTCPNSSFYGEYEDYCVYIGPQTGISDEADVQLTIFPNPASSFIQLVTPYPIQQINLTDLTGKSVGVSYDPTTNILDLHKLATGVYVLFVEVNGVWFTEKISIQR